jgi:hypothetical protein
MGAVAVHKTASVVLADDGVVIHELYEDDREFVTLIRESEKPEQATHDCLAIGARALRGVQTSIDTAVVDKRFGEFEAKLEKGTSEVVRQITTVSGDYLDPEKGELKKMLDQLKAELEKSLGDTFDPKSKESVLARFEAVFAAGTRDLGKAVRDLVDPGNPESPLGRLRQEMGGELREVRKALDELAKHVAVEKASAEASAEMLERTAVKGRGFEEVVFEPVSEFAALYGDTPEFVRTIPGSEGNCVGDILVRLNAEDTPGGQAAYVIEVKDKHLGLKQALDELDRAIANRDAQAGVIVFASQEKAPIPAPCRDYGNKVVAVLDKDEMDVCALRLSLMTARLIVKRQLGDHGGEIDLDGAFALIEEGKRALACHTAIKRFHSAARNQIDDAAKQTAELVSQIEKILNQLGEKLRG